MSTFLLTGAGFSYNWGGWLAAEVNSAIALRLKNDRDLTALLQRTPNFEEALSELQNQAATSARPEAPDQLRKLEDAIVAVFEEMNRNLAAQDFNFCNDLKFSVVEFLALFDAIFTLNQDLLLEKHYLDPPQRLLVCNSRKWSGGILPGTEIIPDAYWTGGQYDPLTVIRRPVATPASTALDPRFQPYYKLHGSVNWHNRNGGRLLVMGGNKPTILQRHPILTWYGTRLVECLSQPNARLVIIGYGFRDLHINQMIVEAWEKGGKTLTMMIAQPDGRQAIRTANPAHNRPLYAPQPIESITVYDATRGLPRIFGGKDAGAHDILINYVKGQ